MLWGTTPQEEARWLDGTSRVGLIRGTRHVARRKTQRWAELSSGRAATTALGRPGKHRHRSLEPVAKAAGAAAGGFWHGSGTLGS
jgi:hypothetical protein